MDSWKQRARLLKREVFALYLAIRDPRTPWYAKALGIVVVAYALSPLDLIPDPIPIIGHLDDLILIPLGIALVLRMIPASVMEESRQRADGLAVGATRAGRIAAGVVVALWVTMFLLAVVLIRRVL